MKKYLTIDIGGTFIKYSVMNEDYICLKNASIVTPKKPEKFLECMKNMIAPLIGKIEGIAMCMAGFIHPETGENTDFSIGNNFKAYNLKKEFETQFGIPVLLENDSNCAALGEMVHGAAKGCKDFCMITFGTGIGAAIVLDGKLHRGRNYKAGEIGFTKVGMNGERKPEGAQAVAGLAALVSAFLNREVNGAYVLNHLQEDGIRSIYDEWLQKAAFVVGNMAVTLDPEKVLIGGGISENDIFMSELREKVYQTYRHLEEYTQIVPCRQGNMAGRIGALYLLREQMVNK